MTPNSAQRHPRSRKTAFGFALVLMALAGISLALTANRAPETAGSLEFFGLWRARHLLLALALSWCAAVALAHALSRRTLRNFLAANVALAATWVALELCVLAGLVSLQSGDGLEGKEQVGQRAIPHLDEVGETREDLALAWRLPSPAIPFRYRTDRRGFRNEPDRESAEVYCLGDSFLVAGLVPFEQVLSAQLERLLERPVMNVALVGLSPQAEAELLLQSDLDLHGRLVLHFVFEGNDLRDSAKWRRFGAGEGPRASWKERTLANWVVLRLQELSQPRLSFVESRTGWIGETPYRFHWLANSFRGFEQELEPLAASLSALRRDVEARGGRYALVLIPAKIRVLGPLCRSAPDSAVADWRAQCGPLPEYVAEWSAREGVPLLDLTDALAESARAGRVPWFPADTHWNAEGHAVAARALAATDFVRNFFREAPPR